MTIAIMQPYFFPYIGYFQLLSAVDKFIFYDDVNYIKGGWINRNRVLIQGESSYFTVRLSSASPNDLIKDIVAKPEKAKMLKTIEFNYKKAPYFNEVMNIVNNVLSNDYNYVCEYAEKSIYEVVDYLKITCVFEKSSIDYPQTLGLSKECRIKKICNINNAERYINLYGGVELYDKIDFKRSNIDISFIRPNMISYNQQGNNNFIPWLSIIDVLMWNSVIETKKMLINYELL